jgi:hypothetical protein
MACERFNLENKVFKIVADQDANMKCAVKNVSDADDLISMYKYINSKSTVKYHLKKNYLRLG